MILKYLIIFVFLCLNITNANNETKHKRFCGTIPISIGKCGEKCEFTFNHHNKTLEIHGEQIDDYLSQFHTPWSCQNEFIQNIVLNDELRSILPLRL